MEGKSIIESLVDEIKKSEKELERYRKATLDFYDEMIEAMKQTNDYRFKDGIAFACSRLTTLLLDKED